MNGPQTFHISAWPPGVNGLYAVVRGRKIKSRRGREWTKEAGQELMLAKPISLLCPVAIGLRFKSPHGASYDLDGKVKVVTDLLVTHGIIPDDSIKFVKQMWLAEGERSGVEISVWPIGSRPPAWVREAVSWEDAA